MKSSVQIEDIQLYFEKKGDGPPVLMIPGLGAGTWLWEKNRATLAQNFELIMPELRGSGRSDKPDYRYSITRFAHDLKALLEHLGIENVHVLGASLGGFVAQYLAAHWPEKVISLVLISTSLGGEHQTGPNGDVLSRMIRPRGRTKKERLEEGYVFSFTEKYIQTHTLDLERITEWRTQFPQPEFAYYRQLLAGNAYDGANIAHKITAPTLICAGESDPLVPMEDVILLHNALPHAHLEIFAGRHLFFFEQGQQFSKVVIDFMKQNEKIKKKTENDTSCISAIISGDAASSHLKR